MGDPDRPHAARRGTERAALAAAAWTAVIYAFIPLVRPIQRALLRAMDPAWITVAVLLVVGLALSAAVSLLRRQQRPVRAFDLAWLSAAAAAAAWCAWSLRSRPEEAIHLLQFGLMAVLIYRALRPAEPDVAILTATVLLGSLVGATWQSTRGLARSRRQRCGAWTPVRGGGRGPRRSRWPCASRRPSSCCSCSASPTRRGGSPGTQSESPAWRRSHSPTTPWPSTATCTGCQASAG
jgi:hypothetical protein